MSFPGHEQQQRAEASDAIAVCSTRAAADFVATTLAAHGIDAVTSWGDWLYPALGWVTGFRVTVAADDEEAARELLRELARDDVHHVPPDQQHDGEGGP